MAFPTVLFYCNPTYPSGVDLWRAITPAKMLAEYGYGALAVPLGHDLVTFNGQWQEVVVHNQRGSTKPGTTKHLRERVYEPHKVLCVADCCDDPEPDVDSPLSQRRKIVRSGWSKGNVVSDLIIDHLRNVHLVTVNSEPMAELVHKYNRHVEILPDLIASGLWNNTTPGNRPPALTIGVAGGDTHKRDWTILTKVWPILAEKYDWLHFVIVGELHRALYECLPQGRRHHRPFTNILRYQQNYRWFDIGCAPLDDAKFNRSKSPIKYYEYSLADAATVASPTVYSQVVQDGVTGCLATSVGEWVNRISELIDQPSVRKEMVRRAKVDVYDNYVLNRTRLEQRLSVYERHYERVYNAKPRGFTPIRRHILSPVPAGMGTYQNDQRWADSRSYH